MADWGPSPEDAGKQLRVKLVFNPGPFKLEGDTVIELPGE